MSIFDEITEGISAEDIQSSILNIDPDFSTTAGVVFDEARDRLPIKSFMKMGEISEAGGLVDPVAVELGYTSEDYMSEEEWKGSEYYHPDLKFEDGVNKGVAKILKERKELELARKDVISRGPEGLLPVVGNFAIGMAAEFTDPLNIGLMMIPIANEAKVAALVGKNKYAIRTVKGSIEGLIGNIPAEAIAVAAYRQEQYDYTIEDSMFNLVIGTAAGGVLGNVVGGIGDVVAKTKKIKKAIDYTKSDKEGFTNIKDPADKLLNREKTYQEAEALVGKELSDMSQDNVINTKNLDDAQALEKTTPVEVVERKTRILKEKRIAMLNDVRVLREAGKVDPVEIPVFDLEETAKYNLYDANGKEIIDPEVRFNKIVEAEDAKALEAALDDKSDIEFDDIDEMVITDEDMIGLTDRIGPPLGSKIEADQSITINLEDRSFLETTRLTPKEAKMYDADYQTFLRDEELERVLHLNMVSSAVEGKGTGNRMLKTLIAHADENNLIVIGTPAGTGKMVGLELENWYKKHGFKMIKDPAHVDSVKMIRFPEEPIEEGIDLEFETVAKAITPLEEGTVRTDGTAVAPKIDDELIGKESIELITEDGSNAQLSKKTKRMAKNYAKMDKFELTDEQANNFWEFNRLNTEVQGKGEGTKLINRVLDIADEQGITIYNNPNAYKDVKAALTQVQLEDWYTRKGFIKLEDTETPTMIRYPKEIAPIKGPEGEPKVTHTIEDQLSKKADYVERLKKYKDSIEQTRLDEIERVKELKRDVKAEHTEDTKKYDLYDRTDPENPKVITDPVVRTEMIITQKINKLRESFKYTSKKEALERGYKPTIKDKSKVFEDFVLDREINYLVSMDPTGRILHTLETTKRSIWDKADEAVEGSVIEKSINRIYKYKKDNIAVMDKLMKDSGYGHIWDYGGHVLKRKKTFRLLQADLEEKVISNWYSTNREFNKKISKLKGEFEKDLKVIGVEEHSFIDKRKLDELLGQRHSDQSYGRMMNAIYQIEAGVRSAEDLPIAYTKGYAKVFKEQLDMVKKQQDNISEAFDPDLIKAYEGILSDEVKFNKTYLDTSIGKEGGHKQLEGYSVEGKVKAEAKLEEVAPVRRDEIPQLEEHERMYVDRVAGEEVDLYNQGLELEEPTLRDTQIEFFNKEVNGRRDAQLREAQEQLQLETKAVEANLESEISMNPAEKKVYNQGKAEEMVTSAEKFVNEYDDYSGDVLQLQNQARLYLDELNDGNLSPEHKKVIMDELDKSNIHITEFKKMQEIFKKTIPCLIGGK